MYTRSTIIPWWMKAKPTLQSSLNTTDKDFVSVTTRIKWNQIQRKDDDALKCSWAEMNHSETDCRREFKWTHRQYYQQFYIQFYFQLLFDITVSHFKKTTPLSKQTELLLLGGIECPPLGARRKYAGLQITTIYHGQMLTQQPNKNAVHSS